MVQDFYFFMLRLEYPHHRLRSHRRQGKANLVPGDINTPTWSSRLGVGSKAGSLTVYKTLLLQNPKSEEIIWNLAESSKKAVAPKSPDLPLMKISKKKKKGGGGPPKPPGLKFWTKLSLWIAHKQRFVSTMKWLALVCDSIILNTNCTFLLKLAKYLFP